MINQKEIFHLLLLSNQKCFSNECEIIPTHVLVGKENELIGLYCEPHGKSSCRAFEEREQFRKENLEKRKRIQLAKYKPLIEKICIECNKAFKTNRNKKKFCSESCRFNNWESKNPRNKYTKPKKKEGVQIKSLDEVFQEVKINLNQVRKKVKQEKIINQHISNRQLDFARQVLLKGGISTELLEEMGKAARELDKKLDKKFDRKFVKESNEEKEK